MTPVGSNAKTSGTSPYRGHAFFLYNQTHQLAMGTPGTPPTYSLEHKPEQPLIPHAKTAVTPMVFIKEPFYVDTQEGVMLTSPETVDDWDEGYYLAYPTDGSKPYSISPKYVRENYAPAQ